MYWFQPHAIGGGVTFKAWLSFFKASFESLGEKVSFDKAVDLRSGEELLLFY